MLWAAALGHLEALRTLLAAGANPAAADHVREDRTEWEERSSGDVLEGEGSKEWGVASSEQIAGRTG